MNVWCWFESCSFLGCVKTWWVKNMWPDMKKEKSNNYLQIPCTSFVKAWTYYNTSMVKVAFGSSELSLRISSKINFCGIMTAPAFKKYKALLVLTWLFSFDMKIMTPGFRGFFCLFVLTFLVILTFTSQPAFTWSKLARVFTRNFEHISHFLLVLVLLTLNM